MKHFNFFYMAVLLIFMPASAWTAPKAELWDAWTAHNASSQIEVDHSQWDMILKSYLVTDDPSGINLFSYSQVSPADRDILDSYLQSLETTRVDGLNRNEQMAYWINLYNALTVRVILDSRPVKSIRDINPGGGGLFSKGPWDAKVARIQGIDVSLNDIEHRILRPAWKDPRIHYAVNCASIGCPNLQPAAFTGKNLYDLLERAAEEYINHPRGVEADGRILRLSSIYDWFSTDFGKTEAEIIRHIYTYARADLRRNLDPFMQAKAKIRYRYDWSLNTL